MTWLLTIALAGIALAVALFVLRMERSVVTTFALALVLGLAGYAWQARPDAHSAPAANQVAPTSEIGWQMVEARKRMTGEEEPLPRPMIVADAFVRQGQYGDAANVLRNALRDRPSDPIGWLALGNALVAHAEDTLTPAAIEAYRRSAELDPDAAGPDFFIGAALIRQGELEQGRAIWAERLAAAPDDAPWREELAMRLGRLDAILELAQEQPSVAR